MAGPGERGLTAVELGAVLAELAPILRGAELLDVAQPGEQDDLLFVLSGGDGKAFLHVAPGGPRARLCLTARRWPKDAFATGPRIDHLRAALTGATLVDITQPAGERRCVLQLQTAVGRRRLVVELFGARGAWALLDDGDIVRELSRPVTTAVRSLTVGQPYAAPPPAPGATAEPPPRFAEVAAVDAHFTAADLRAELQGERERLQRIVERATQKTRAKADGLGKQLADTGRSDALRAEADLMLAYAHAVPRGAARMIVPDPLRDDADKTIELDPSRPVTLQAKDRYDKARRLDDGRAFAEQRLAAARRELATLADLAAVLAAAMATDALATPRAALQRLGLLPKPKAPSPTHKQPRAQKGHDFRRFLSAEGYPILVGKNNEQNDILTLRVAAGNDLWLHVGGGRPGSHVVIRLPKGKTASLETLLDAGTLAIHFSKARGERLLDVIYTQKKHVRKPKGLPAGAVVPAQTKTITVRLDEDRLRRLLDSADPDDRRDDT